MRKALNILAWLFVVGYIGLCISVAGEVLQGDQPTRMEHMDQLDRIEAKVEQLDRLEKKIDKLIRQGRRWQ